jgi:hypothetical protein
MNDNFAPSHPSMLEAFLGIALVTILSLGAWSLFTSMPAYGATPTPSASVTQTLPTPPPACFNHVREQVLAQDPQTMVDIARGCPPDPMAYAAGTLRQVQG